MEVEMLNSKGVSSKKRIIVFFQDVKQLLDIDPLLSTSEENLSLLKLKLEKSIDLKSFTLDTFWGVLETAKAVLKDKNDDIKASEKIKQEIIEFNADEVIFFDQGNLKDEVCENLKAIVGSVQTRCFNGKDEFYSFLDNCHVAN